MRAWTLAESARLVSGDISGSRLLRGPVITTRTYKSW